MIRIRTVWAAWRLAAALALAGCATAPPPSEGAGAARLSAGLNRLGAAPERSACFADTIGAALEEPGLDEAVAIVELSASKEEMRGAVLAASKAVKQSFIRAHFRCSFLK